jgi:pimeloyl-ACP methyl ester carboxylesterase
VIHGDEDSAIEMPAAQALAAGLVGAGEVFVVEGAAHAANLTHPERVNFALLHFLHHL